MKKPNHTQVPNDFFDEVMCTLNGTETKVYLAICRKTLGWHKEKDAIAKSQIIEMTGSSENAVVEAIHRLEKMKLVQIDRSTGGRGKGNCYTLLFDDEETQKETPPEIAPLFELNPPRNCPPQKKEEKERRERKGAPYKKSPLIATLMKFNFTTCLWDGIEDEQIKAWEIAYPACDIETELARMREWIMSNGAKGHKVQWRKFITNWLGRAQDRGGSNGIRAAR